MIDITIERVKSVLFNCNLCGWIGSELEIDVISSFDNDLVCCPCCSNDDIRVFNENN